MTFCYSATKKIMPGEIIQPCPALYRYGGSLESAGENDATT